MASPTAHARFHIGQIVHQRLFDYRGVSVDIDPVFLGTEAWYERVAEHHLEPDPGQQQHTHH